MREILFRGKTLSGKWVEGIYSPYNWDIDLVRENKPQIIILSENKDDIDDGLWCDIIPETAGQYTGLTDKNGTKIFEGDIIESVSRLVNSVGTPTGGTDISRYIIEWGEHKWVKKIFFCNRGDYWKRNNVLPEDLYPYTASRYCEVIGNIYDNSELLGGGEEDD